MLKKGGSAANMARPQGGVTFGVMQTAVAFVAAVT